MEIIKRSESIESYATEDGFDIVELVGNATWRELIVMLVETNKLDPWNIDITKIVDSYVETINKMKLLDLFMPANIIFAASVLLRIKSDTMKFFEEPPEEFYQEDEPHTRDRPEVGELVARTRHQPQARITLEQLMVALDDAIKVEAKRVERERFYAEPVELNIEVEDIDKKIGDVLKLVSDNSDSYGITSFNSVRRYFPDGYGMLMDFFVPLLYLHNNGSVAMSQEEFFGEIMIKVMRRE
ncbi:MAG: segregation/condensation protein A, partial [Candidatus Micrarchaeaceae archaeon]